MSIRHLSDPEVRAFAERLDAFGQELLPDERRFLRAILGEVAGVQDGDDSGSDAEACSLAEMVIGIHRAYLTPSISLNPQPIPPDVPHRSGS